MKNYRATN